MDINETVRSRGKIRPGFLGNMGRMVVQDHADGRLRRVMGIEFLEEADKLPAPVALVDLGDHMAVLKVQCRQDGGRSQTLVFVVPGDGRVFSRNRRKIRSHRGESLHSRLLVHADGDDRTAIGGFLLSQGHLLVGHEDLAHLAVEFGILPFEVVGDLVGLQGLSLQNPVNRRLGRF